MLSGHGLSSSNVGSAPAFSSANRISSPSAVLVLVCICIARTLGPRDGTPIEDCDGSIRSSWRAHARWLHFVRRVIGFTDEAGPGHWPADRARVGDRLCAARRSVGGDVPLVGGDDDRRRAVHRGTRGHRRVMPDRVAVRGRRRPRRHPDLERAQRRRERMACHTSGRSTIAVHRDLVSVSVAVRRRQPERRHRHFHSTRPAPVAPGGSSTGWRGRACRCSASRARQSRCAWPLTATGPSSPRLTQPPAGAPGSGPP